LFGGYSFTHRYVLPLQCCVKQEADSKPHAGWMPRHGSTTGSEWWI
jgi:hypothetical protein